MIRIDLAQYTRMGLYGIPYPKGQDIFLDIKLNDIPNTIKATLRALKKKKIKWVSMWQGNKVIRKKIY